MKLCAEPENYRFARVAISPADNEFFSIREDRVPFARSKSKTDPSAVQTKAASRIGEYSAVPCEFVRLR
jgi:hypothetical protein